MYLILSGWGNDNDMRVVDAIFDEYAIVHTIKTKEGKSEVLNKLHSKSSLHNIAETIFLKDAKCTLNVSRSQVVPQK